MLWLCPLSGALAASLTVRVQGADGKPLADAVVYLDSAAARAAARPLAGAQIAQEGKTFVPTVKVVTVGTMVEFPNRDRVRHHVYSLSPVKPFELKLYAGAPANPVQFDKPGLAVLGCNIHDSMIAWVVVVETPHFARTGADGLVRLNDVPAGDYTLSSWHPALPVGASAQQQKLVLPAAGAELQVKLPVTDGKAGA